MEPVNSCCRPSSLDFYFTYLPVGDFTSHQPSSSPVHIIEDLCMYGDTTILPAKMAWTQ